MKLVVAAVRPTPILWWRASGLESPTEVPASTLPARGTAPVRANIASRSVVLPLWKGPTSAMHRGPRGLLTSCPIAASFIWSSALDWVGGWMLPRHQRFGKPEKRRWRHATCPGAVQRYAGDAKHPPVTMHRRPTRSKSNGPGSAAHRHSAPKTRVKGTQPYLPG